MKTAFSHFFASLPMTSLSQRHQRDGWVTATDSLRLRARPAPSLASCCYGLNEKELYFIAKYAQMPNFQQ